MTDELGSTPTTTPPTEETAVPTRLRRFACMMYEGMLLFGVLFISDYLFDVLTQSRHALMYRHARQAWLFLVLGSYFVWFWTHGGQTLAMKTWHVRLVDISGKPVSRLRAAVRYCLCYPLALSGAGFIWSLWDKDNQFLQDRIAGTRLISFRATYKSQV